MKRFLALVLVTMLVLSSTSAFAEWLYATDGKTNIRRDADINSKSMGVFHKGEKIWVYDHVYTPDGRNWCKVRYEGKIAYISDRYSSYDVSNPNDFVDLNAGMDENEELPKEQQTINPYFKKRHINYWYDDDYSIYGEFEYEEEFEFEVLNKVKVRASASYDADILGKISAGMKIYGSRIYTAADGSTWLAIYGKNDQLGYVPMESLKLTMGLVNNHFPILSRYMVVTGESVNVHVDPDIDSTNIDLMYEDDIIIVDYYVCVYDGERRMWAHAYDEYGNYLGFLSTLYLTATQG